MRRSNVPLRRRRALLVCLACAAPAVLAQGDDPRARLQQLEARVLAAPRVAIEADIRASGAISAHLTGRVELKDRNRASETWSGELRGQPAQLSLSSDGRTLEVSAGGQPHREAPARESNHALLAGALRVGLWHEIERLAQLQAPDHAAGGVEDWAVAGDFGPSTVALGGDAPGAQSFGYELKLDGVESGGVRLWLDPVTGLPRRRQTLLRLPEGEATVIETYTRFALE